jgi:hypothetical protein
VRRQGLGPKGAPDHTTGPSILQIQPNLGKQVFAHALSLIILAFSQVIAGKGKRLTLMS